MRVTLIWTAIALAALAAFGSAQTMPQFEQEVIDHVPDMSSLEKIAQASQNLSKLEKEHPELRDKVRVDLGMGPGARRGGPPSAKLPTLDELANGLKAHPEATQAVESTGLSVRDYFKNVYSVVYGWTVFQMDKRGMLAQMQQMMPTLKTPASLDFIRAHEAEVQKYLDQIRKAGSN
jgi:hypothetical protein